MIEVLARYPLSSCSRIIFFSLSGFLSREGPNIRLMTASPGRPSTKDLLKVAGYKVALFRKSHSTPPTMGSGRPFIQTENKFYKIYKDRKKLGKIGKDWKRLTEID